MTKKYTLDYALEDMQNLVRQEYDSLSYGEHGVFMTIQEIGKTYTVFRPYEAIARLVTWEEPDEH